MLPQPLHDMPWSLFLFNIVFNIVFNISNITVKMIT